jgi:hypothetical protein
MHLSLLWRQHWRLVALAGALAAGFLAAAPAAGVLVAAMGTALLGLERILRWRGAVGGLLRETVGDFGYLEMGPPADPGRESE